MELVLRRMRGDITSLAGYTDIAIGTILSQEVALLRLRSVFTWDCATALGRPEPRRVSIRPSCVVTFALSGSSGGIESEKTQEMMDEILELADVANTRALVANLNEAIPPPRFEIDYAVLADPYLANYSIQIFAAVKYLSCIYRPRAGRIGNHFIVFVPHLVTFMTFITERCFGILPVGTTVAELSPHVVPEPPLATLEAEVMRDLEETWRRNRKRMPEFSEPSWRELLDFDDPFSPFAEDDDEDDSSDQDEQQDQSEDKAARKSKPRGRKKPG